MKIFSEVVLILCLTKLINSSGLDSASRQRGIDRYLVSLSTDIVNSMVKKAKQMPTATLVPQPVIEPTTQSSEPAVKIVQAGVQAPERKLGYESLTNSYLLGDGDDTSTTNHLSMLVSQQKAMQNFRVVGDWLNDLENNLDDLRDAVNRRVSDLATGLQRRNQLLGHYNYIGQGMGIPGPGFSGPEPML